ncbi:uncharacterized protein AMSG_03749 [Thecamonas trahens ATCC 50062]|uniref:Uncharacterized protein n=1 Tax=Thecamonas trahens ATCC 50062 TaxID=461836 RepID=A0A0L0D5F3_THETB|nr:hypothetical protein AMSG_03749 [Thecamonas trahens ATCC 50062]KNC47316.1 hypothetical protein AMSG_03749 [Thecamonas trahens ATCC 50062]|eukprot:XP_013759654.1 hypothetical protein AMSG_03749 [Thecamonas trahens ATCC 50062]
MSEAEELAMDAVSQVICDALSTAEHVALAAAMRAGTAPVLAALAAFSSSRDADALVADLRVALAHPQECSDKAAAALPAVGEADGAESVENAAPDAAALRLLVPAIRGHTAEAAAAAAGCDDGEVTPWVTIGLVVSAASDVHVLAHVAAVLAGVRLAGHPVGSPFRVVVVAAADKPVVRTLTGLTILADAVLTDVPPLDAIIVVPVWASDGRGMLQSAAESVEALGPAACEWLAARAQVVQFTIGLHRALGLGPSAEPAVFAQFVVRGGSPEPSMPLAQALGRLAAHWLGGSGTLPDVNAISYTPPASWT